MLSHRNGILKTKIWQYLCVAIFLLMHCAESLLLVINNAVIGVAFGNRTPRGTTVAVLRVTIAQNAARLAYNLE